MHIEPATRRSLVWETWFVMVAFLYSGVAAAVVLIIRHALGAGGSPDPFADLIPGHTVASFIVGIPVYLEVAAVVPITLFLLQRTGQSPAALGIGRPGWSSDIWPAIGLMAATFGAELLMTIPIAPFLNGHPGLLNPTQIGAVPHYYIIYGVGVSAITAVAEEVTVNGYLITRLEQLGWTPKRALVLSLVLRTSYHVYYGVGFIFVIPFGYFVTRSFQKHKRLTRAITTHFLWDATLFAIAVFTGH